MERRRYTPAKLARIEGSTRFFKSINCLLSIGLAVAFGLFIGATAIPQRRALIEQEAKLKNILERENDVLESKESTAIELHALREDTAYLEIQARDRLNYYRPGERVLRFKSFD